MVRSKLYLLIVFVLASIVGTALFLEASKDVLATSSYTSGYLTNQE